jgi:hypothetical protein
MLTKKQKWLIGLAVTFVTLVPVAVYAIIFLVAYSSAN